jgi:hypothetical protein
VDATGSIGSINFSLLDLFDKLFNFTISTAEVLVWLPGFKMIPVRLLAGIQVLLRKSLILSGCIVCFIERH